MKTIKAAGPPVRFARDGKELRGSIQTGHTRGEVCVLAVAHQGQQVVGQTFYCGTKESERPAVSQLLKQHHLSSQKITLDALHMIPRTLRLIHGRGGSYVVGLKANQITLHRQNTCLNLFKKPDFEHVDAQKKRHGRLEGRTYRCYSLASSMLAPRWQPTGLATLMCVKRIRQQTGVLREETAYFVSNVKPTTQAQAEELFGAIRQHWCIEVMPHKRDVSLREDDLRTGKTEVSRLVSSLRTLVINLLEGMRLKNTVAQLETFADKFPTLIHFLTQQMVL